MKKAAHIVSLSLKKYNLFSFMLVLSLFVSHPSHAQQNDSTAVKQNVVYTFLTLKDATTISGKIVKETAGQLVVDDIIVGEVTINKDQVVKRSDVKPGAAYCFELKGGQQYCGTVTETNDSLIYISTPSIGRIRLFPSQISEIRTPGDRVIVNGEEWFENPDPTRYLFVPSAIPLKKGDGYYQNIWISGNTMHYGVTDHFSLGGGILFPLAYMFTGKFGYKVADNVHVAAGGVFCGTFYGIDFGLGAAYGAVTIGNTNNNFTLSSGYGFAKEYSGTYYNSRRKWQATQRPMFSASGMWRLANHFSLVTENWFYATPHFSSSGSTVATYNYHGIYSLGFRSMWKRSAVDLAAVYIGQSGSEIVAAPYLDYVLRF